MGRKDREWILNWGGPPDSDKGLYFDYFSPRLPPLARKFEPAMRDN
jgi:hypothetical protein